MSDFLEDLYCTIHEHVAAQDLHYEERMALAKAKEPLREELSRRLGQEGLDLLDRFMNLDDEIGELRHYEVFRRTLAVGLELGRLPSSLSV